MLDCFSVIFVFGKCVYYCFGLDCLILMIELKKGGIWFMFNLLFIMKNWKELGYIYWFDIFVNLIFIGKLFVLWLKWEDVKFYVINLINWNDVIW